MKNSKAAKQTASLATAHNPNTKLTVAVEPEDYGRLATAAKIHNVTIARALEIFIGSEQMSNWQNEGYAV